MSKNIILDGQTYNGVSEVELPVSGGTAKFKDEDEIPAAPSGTKQITANGNGIDVAAFEKVDVNVPTSGEHTPEISINANGLITASCGGESTTHQLSASDNADFVAANIKDGVTIFGVEGTLSGGGGITDGVEVLERDSNGYATSIRHWGTSVRKAQYGCDDVNYSPSHVTSFINIEQVDLNNATSIRQVAFCATHLTSVASDLVTSLGVGAFAKCVSLISANFPNANTDTSLFMNCTALKTVILKNFTNGSQIFKGCTALENVTIGGIGAQCGVPASDNIFSGCDQSGLTVTVYCKGNDGISTIVSKIRGGATNATIVVKASHDTTYQEQSYTAGETILTDVPSVA